MCHWIRLSTMSSLPLLAVLTVVVAAATANTTPAPTTPPGGLRLRARLRQERRRRGAFHSHRGGTGARGQGRDPWDESGPRAGSCGGGRSPGGWTRSYGVASTEAGEGGSRVGDRCRGLQRSAGAAAPPALLCNDGTCHPSARTTRRPETSSSPASNSSSHRSPAAASKRRTSGNPPWPRHGGGVRGHRPSSSFIARGCPIARCLGGRPERGVEPAAPSSTFELSCQPASSGP